MRNFPSLPAAIALLLAPPLAYASPTLCDPKVIGERTVETTAQTVAAGARTLPHGIVGPTGFDWNDTELGVTQAADGKHLLFFASDGSCHHACNKANERDGSITLTQGTLDEPLAGPPAMESLIGASGIKLPPYMLYAGGGTVLRVPFGAPAQGTLLLVYQAARASYAPGYHYPDCNAHGICNTHQNGFYSYLALAASKDDGHSWRNLGLVLSPNASEDIRRL